MFEDLYLLYQAIFLNYDVRLGHSFQSMKRGNNHNRHLFSDYKSRHNSTFPHIIIQ